MSEADHFRAFGWDPIAHMNRAAARKPASGGKNYTRMAKRSDHAPIDYDSIETWGGMKSRVILGWFAAKTDVLEQFRFDVNGQEWEGFQ